METETPAELLRQAAELLRQPAPPVADLPFALTAQAVRRPAVQPAFRLEREIAEPRD